MIIFPQAKINLGLKVLRKREDGYHDLSTIMFPIPLTDVLEILPASTFEFHQTGLVISGQEKDNLIVKAYELMKAEYSIPPVYIHLRKEIPMGAGLGGGSSDAASTIVGLNDLFELGLSIEKMEEHAAQLGSDCPFFIRSVPQCAEGRGEMLSPINIDLNGYYLVLVNPGIHVGTKEAYAGVTPSERGDEPRYIIKSPMKFWKNDLINDFEDSIMDMHPALSLIKGELYYQGAVYAAMSGSGSTMYGIFKDKPNVRFNSKYSTWVLTL